VAGEPGGSIDATRQAIEELWDAKVYDFYGIRTFRSMRGNVQREKRSSFVEDHILVEVINPDTLEPVAEGERGNWYLPL